MGDGMSIKRQHLIRKILQNQVLHSNQFTGKEKDLMLYSPCITASGEALPVEADALPKAAMIELNRG
jgi:hypothetical protein